MFPAKSLSAIRINTGPTSKIPAAHRVRVQSAPPSRRFFLSKPMWRRAWIFDLDNTLHDSRPHIFSAHHCSRAVLKTLAIGDLFDDVFSIERTRYRFKPDTLGFLRMCRANRLRPQRCIMLAYLQ
jgi:hypothetical protein